MVAVVAVANCDDGDDGGGGCDGWEYCYTELVDVPNGSAVVVRVVDNGSAVVVAAVEVQNYDAGRADVDVGVDAADDGPGFV